jgi:hypothetical protein
MTRVLRAALLTLGLAAGPALAADYDIKADKSAPPKELSDAVRKQLGDRSVQFLDGKGKVLSEVWFCKEIPAEATAAQIQNGLTYQEVPQTTLLGVIKVDEAVTDYRKQKIKAGLYTMRLAFQPMDGDHMGTAPFAEFVILVPVKADEGKATLDPEALVKLGKRSTGTGHPGVLLLFPVAKKDLGKAPALAKKEGATWVLSVTVPVNAAGKKGTIGVGLTLVGVSSAI